MMSKRGRGFHIMAVWMILTNAKALQSAPVDAPPAPASEWHYGDEKSWPSACSGERQSPININPSKVVEVPGMARMTFINYDIIFPQVITNNGHTMMLRLKTNQQGDDFPSIKDGGLPGRFVFDQLHFHWGGSDSRGSEHRIAGRRYPAELHIVHYNEKYFSMSNATKYPDGVAVLAFFIEREKRDNTAFRHIEHFQKILHANASVADELRSPVELDDLIPDNPYNFYRYNGSLTTPGCSEAVIWTVFESTIGISERQLKEFRNLFDAEGHFLEDNDRPIQPLHDRIVLYRFELMKDQV